jgi:hypothetical protein
VETSPAARQFYPQEQTLRLSSARSTAGQKATQRLVGRLRAPSSFGYASNAIGLDKQVNVLAPLVNPLGDFLLAMKANGDPTYRRFLNKHGDVEYCSFQIVDRQYFNAVGV